MFNTDIRVNNQSNNQTVNNNEASTGRLVKISKTSKIAKFRKGDAMEQRFFSDDPYYIKYNVRKTREEHGMYIPYDTDEYYKIDILQVVIFGDDQFLVEYEIGESF